MGCSKSTSKTEVHSDTGLPQETRKTSNKQSKFTFQGTIKEEQMKAKVSRRKKLMKNRTELNRD